MFLIGTAYIMANTSYKVLAYTTHRNFPGGPVSWINANYSSPTTLSSNICAVISSWGADGLLVGGSISNYMKTAEDPFTTALSLLYYIQQLPSAGPVHIGFANYPLYW